MARLDASTIAAGKSRWVEKTPRHILRIGTILRRRPDAKIVLVLRDGRDVACSIRDRTGNLEGGIRRWVEDNRAGQGFWSDPRVQVLRYEELVADFDATVGGIVGFLGENYEPGMRDFHSTPRRFYSDDLARPSSAFGTNHGQYRNWQINQPLFDGRGRWRRLGSGDLAVVERVAGSMLRDLGYAKEGLGPAAAAGTLDAERHTMAKAQSGVLQGTSWSSEEGKKALYEFARELGLAGVNSRTGKPDIVKALVKAQKKQDKATPEKAAPVSGSQSKSRSRSRSRSRSNLA